MSIEESQRKRIWDMLYQQALGMGHDDLAEYYADAEVDDYDEQSIKDFPVLKEEDKGK